MTAPEELWGSMPALVEYYTTHNIPLHPQPGILVLSIIVSILGSYATLLLLGRRTSNRGWRNLGFLLVSAICFAAVAVWGMHFVSMISVRLEATPQITWYVQFQAGMTALSLFVPLIATTFAFWFLGDDPSFVADKDDSWKAALHPRNLLGSWRIIVGGVFVGLTIGLMHYSASFELPFLVVSYTAVTVVFALILACIAAIAALALFFRARQQWQESFWKRGICSLFLATAVCGMHYLGLGGTSYRVQAGVPEIVLERNTQNTRLIIAISVMCAAIIILSLLLAILDYRTRAQMKAKSKNIVLASVAFDENGRILVKPDGTIPMQIMQTDANLQGLIGLLDPRMSSFQWLYQMSFCWKSAVVPYVPRILKAKAAKGTFADPAMVAAGSGKEALEKWSFRSRFIEAAVLLAHSLDLSVDSLGVLFDRVLTTGTKVFQPQEEAEKFTPRRTDDESSIHGITMKLGASEGVMCFMAREIGKGKPASADLGGDQTKATDTVDYYLERGWRLAETRFFSKLLADYMGVSKAEMDVFLNACKTYAKRGTQPVVQEGGVYLGMFGVRPTIGNDPNIDVLVYNFARHQIPAYRLPDIQMPLNGRCRAWLDECRGLTMGDMLDKCNDGLAVAETASRQSHTSLDENEVYFDFLAALAVSLESLTTALRVWPTISYLAKLYPTIIELPCSETDDKRPAQMILLSCILPAPEAKLSPVQTRASGIQVPNLNDTRRDWDKPPAPFVYTPWNLFCRSQTMILRGPLAAQVSKALASEINRMYALPAADLAAEVAMEDSNQGQVNPFADAGGLGPGGLPRRGKRGTQVELRSNSSSDEKSIADSSMHLHAAVGGTPRSRTSKGSPEQALRGAINSLVGKQQVVDEEELQEMGSTTGAYAKVRQGADNWYVRVMESLAEGDVNKDLQFTDWRSQAKIMPLN